MSSDTAIGVTGGRAHANKSHDIRHKTLGLCANDATGSARVYSRGKRAKASFLGSFLTAEDCEEWTFNHLVLKEREMRQCREKRR